MGCQFVYRLSVYFLFALGDNSSAKIFGHCWDGTAVVRDRSNKKQFVPPSEFPNSTFPRYCSGTGYMLTWNGPSILWREAPRHPWLFIEDVLFSGLLA